MKSIINFIILFTLTLHACSENANIPGNSQLNFNDTIRINKVQTFLGGDTLIEHQVITFAQNDLTMPVDSFYYEAMGKYPNKGENYRMYFDRKKVVAYCDSMLNALKFQTPENFEDMQNYRSILNRSRQGNAETTLAHETHYLMNRFRPLIVNSETGHKPNFYFTIIRRSSQREDIERHFVTEKGETFRLSWQNIWLAASDIDTTK